MTRLRPPPAAIPVWIPLVALLLTIAAGPGLLPRLAFDRKDHLIEFVVDLPGLARQAEAAGVPLAQLLENLQAAGITGVAIHPRSLSDLIEDGTFERSSASPGHRGYRESATPRRYSPALALKPFAAVATVRDGIEVSGGVSTEHLRVILPNDLLPAIQAAGLRPVLRLKNSAVRASYPEHLLELAPPGSLVIFDDKEALGYPAALRPVAAAMDKRQLSVGLVEFSGQRGVQALASLGKLPMLTVHSIPDDEMEKYPLGRVLPRWVRAAKERHVRVMYLRGFPDHNLPFHTKTSLEANLLYFQRVRDLLAKSGYQPGRPLNPVSELALPAVPYRFLAAMAAGAYLAWMLAYFRFAPPFFLVVAGIALGLAVAIAGGARGYGLLANLLALCAACSAPAAAVLEASECSARGRSPTRGIFLGLPLVYLASAAAGVVVFVLLSHPGFLTRALDFRGVKLVYLGTLALVGAYHLKRHSWHQRRLRTVELGLLGLGALFGLVYIARSGNFSPLPASGAEHRLRDTLERVLPYRPRTKEVAVGYPMLGVMAGAAAHGDLFWAGWSSLGGTVAGVSATNSFCHLKTSFTASLGRGAIGLLFGLPLAWIAAGLHGLFLRRRQGSTWVLAGYAGHGNFGDDWITTRLLAELEARRPPGVELVLLVPDPEACQERFGVRGVSRRSLFAILTELRHAELFATGPGGLVQDRTGWASPVYYLGLHALARLVGVPRVAFLGEGFGPLASRGARLALQHYAGAADLVLVRDEASATLAGERSVQAPDASLWGSEASDRPTPAPSKGPLGLVLRDAGDGKTCHALPLARALATLAKDRGLGALVLLPAHPERDQPLTSLVTRALAKEDLEVTASSLHDSLAEGALKELSALASMRLHGCLLAFEHQIPLLALPYDPKVEAILETSGYPHQVAPWASPEDLYAAAEALLNDLSGASEKLFVGRKKLAIGQNLADQALDDLLGPPLAPKENQDHMRRSATSSPPSA